MEKIKTPPPLPHWRQQSSPLHFSSFSDPGPSLTRLWIPLSGRPNCSTLVRVSFTMAILLLALLVSTLARGTTAAEMDSGRLSACTMSCIAQHNITSCAAADIACICVDTPFLDAVAQCVVTVTQLTSLPEATQRFLSDACHAPVRDQSGKALAIASVFAVLAIVAIAARLYTRYLVVGKMALGDYLAILNLLTAIALSSLIIYLTQNGLGKDIFQLEFNQITQFLHLFYVGVPLYHTTTVLTKIVILLLYKRVFGIDPVFLRIAYGTATVCISYWVAFMAVDIFQCIPVSYAWTRWDGEHQGSCIAYLPATYAVSIINIVLDVWIISLPWPRLLNMQMNWKKRIHALLMVSVGAFITLISALRLSSLQQYADSENPTCIVQIGSQHLRTVANNQGAGDYIAIGYYSVIEANVGVVCTCMPDIRTLLIRFWPAISGSTHPHSSEHYSGATPAVPSQNRSRNAPVHSAGVEQITESGKYNPPQEINIHGGRKRTHERGDMDSVSVIELIEVESGSRIAPHSSNGSWESLGRHLDG
ncbi:hypothetical protein ACJZ2D_011987 [Fusarium nematophilum]